MREIAVLVPYLSALSLAACVSSSANPGADAGADAAGSPDGDAALPADDDGEPFPEGRVPTLEIALAPADWQAMLDDMTDMLGAFGAAATDGGGPGGPPGGEPPDEVLAACGALAEGDACSAVVAGQTIQGQCIRIPDGRLACAPSGPGGPGGPGGPEDGMPMGDTDLIPRTPIWVPCTVRFEGRTWEHVGVRFKGNASLRDAWQNGVVKLPLRLKFDAYEDEVPATTNQRFVGGLRLLSLSNGNRDPSLARAKLGNDLFLAAGLPSQRSGFYRVVVDRGFGLEYFGVYVASEMPTDDVFLARAFGTADGEAGNLYQPDGAAATWSTYDEADLVKENHETAADYSDVRALYDALHADRADMEAFRAGLDSRFDVDLFLRWLALNAVVQDWDTYGVGPHNYYLYADPADGGRFAWIPWDHSESLRTDPRALSLGMDEVDERWPLIRYVLDDPRWRARYDALLAEATQGPFQPGATEQLIRDTQELIAPHVIGPDGERPGFTFLEDDEQFTAAYDELVQHVRARADAVRSFAR